MLLFSFSNPYKSKLPADFDKDSGSVVVRERRDSNFGLKEFRRASSLLLAENEKQSRKASTVSRKASTVSRQEKFYFEIIWKRPTMGLTFK